MARTRRTLPSAAAAAASGPKERHRRAQRSQYDRQAPVPQGFVAKPPIPKSKHHTYFEFVENTERKKKKLEFQITTRRTPAPGFEFVPIGNPQLTTACKELSREKDAMIFIVSNSKEADTTQLAYQVHRVGHHIRQAIVEEAKASIIDMPHHVVSLPDGEPEPIPESQDVYHAQADAAIRDLFPRIPNTDRQMIIEHAFTRGPSNRTEKPVGLSDDITLARRVQLAVLAHIRHNHTRYDELLRETTWQNARKVVEALCLDILVKWRGDEETGRDQLEEILREVVVISDSEQDSADEDSTDDTSIEGAGHGPGHGLGHKHHGPGLAAPQFSSQADARSRPSPSAMFSRVHIHSSPAPAESSRPRAKAGNQSVTAAKRAQRGFKRYRAWEDAIRRSQVDDPLSHHHYHRHPPLDVQVGERLPQPSGARTAQFHDPRTYAPSIATGTAPVLHGAPSYGHYEQPVYKPVPVPVPVWASSRHDGRHRLIQRSDYQVESVVLNQAPSTSLRQRVSPPGSNLQDMLVRSIEPASPEARPPFVRALADPTSPKERDRERDLPRLDLGMYHRAGPALHRGRTSPADDRVFHSRGQMDAPGLLPQQQHPLPGVPPEARPAQAVYIRDRDLDCTLPHGMPNTSSPVLRPMARPMAHPHDPAAPPPQGPLGRRIVVNAPRPGIRSNLVLMEDRGGFYERINAHAELQQLPPSLRRPTESHETQTMARDGKAAREPRPSPLRRRIAPEDRAATGLRATPATYQYEYEHVYHPQTTRLPLGGRPFPGHDEPPHPPAVNGDSSRDLRQWHREREGPRRPVPEANQIAAQPEGYWVTNRSRGHHQAYYEHAQPVHERYETWQHHHLHDRSRAPQDIIVVD